MNFESFWAINSIDGMKFNAELHESVFSQALIKDKAWNTEDNKRQSTTNKEKQYQKRFTSERDILYISPAILQFSFAQREIQREIKGWALRVIMAPANCASKMRSQKNQQRNWLILLGES